jgi:Flp pilus assembly protein TadB
MSVASMLQVLLVLVLLAWCLLALTLWWSRDPAPSFRTQARQRQARETEIAATTVRYHSDFSRAWDSAETQAKTVKAKHSRLARPLPARREERIPTLWHAVPRR